MISTGGGGWSLRDNRRGGAKGVEKLEACRSGHVIGVGGADRFLPRFRHRLSSHRITLGDFHPLPYHHFKPGLGC